MITTTDIPHDQWRTYCRDFTKRHAGWPVTVESIQYDSRNRVLTNEDKEFEFVTVYPEKEAGETAQIEVGTNGAEHQTMIVPALSGMKVETMANGMEAGLEIFSKEHGIIIIRFQSSLVHSAVLRGEPTVWRVS